MLCVLHDFRAILSVQKLQILRQRVLEAIEQARIVFACPGLVKAEHIRGLASLEAVVDRLAFCRVLDNYNFEGPWA